MLVCVGLSYLAAVAALLLGAVSLVAPTGALAVATLWVAVVFAVAALGLLLVDAVLRRRPEGSPVSFRPI